MDSNNVPFILSSRKCRQVLSTIKTHFLDSMLGFIAVRLYVTQSCRVISSLSSSPPCCRRLSPSILFQSQYRKTRRIFNGRPEFIFHNGMRQSEYFLPCTYVGDKWVSVSTACLRLRLRVEERHPSWTVDTYILSSRQQVVLQVGGWTRC